MTCQSKCNTSVLQPICCLTCHTLNKMADILSIARNSCELALYEMRGLNGEAEAAREALSKAVESIGDGKEILRRFSALLSLMKTMEIQTGITTLLTESITEEVNYYGKGRYEERAG